MINDVLLMPEYGRNVQRMVEYALTIEDKEERTRCVQSIMHTMENLFPYLRDEESRHKMYDHLAIMSGFKLDIDSPYNQPSPDELKYNPQTLPYNTTIPLKHRHYGRILLAMIDEAVKIDDKDTQQRMILQIALRMRQNFAIWNKDYIDAAKIKEDMAELSNGKLNCDFPEFEQVLNRPSIPQLNNQVNQKKKKKRKK